mmetsp:Transcript_120690/g.240337  ORF Transcript_120690/g.240337 Transcript_120690/m.240337 type:complete len:548 (-) Transcript_120690:6-1649(-)
MSIPVVQISPLRLDMLKGAVNFCTQPIAAIQLHTAAGRSRHHSAPSAVSDTESQHVPVGVRYSAILVSLPGLVALQALRRKRCGVQAGAHTCRLSLRVRSGQGDSPNVEESDTNNRSLPRRSAGFLASGSLLGTSVATAEAKTGPDQVVNGIRRKKLGSSNIMVSECGLGTQRWASDDFNAPDENMCYKFLDRAVLDGGVNLVDTAEQYPIPSSPKKPEGLTEEVIGRWIAKDKGRREKIVVATKITGGLNVNAKNIRKDLEGSLKRLQSDYVDVYLTHWSFRLSQPQQNWGQSLQYRSDVDPFAKQQGQATFVEVVTTMDALVREGKIRGWGCCNESPYGATRLVATAKQMGLTPPCAFQNDYSLVNRRCEENGLFEMCSPYNENVGFMAYNVLAGGMLTGKYLQDPAAPDQIGRDPKKALELSMKPRGRMDDISWGRTLYRYRSEPATNATQSYAKIAGDSGLSLTSLALQWTRQREGVTSALVGHSSLAQLDEDLEAFRNSKPLPDRIMWEIDRVHMRNRLPIFASEHVGAEWYGEGEIGEPIP